MKIFTTLGLIFSTLWALGQSHDLRFTNITNTGNELRATVQVQASGSSFDLGGNFGVGGSPQTSIEVDYDNQGSGAGQINFASWTSLLPGNYFSSGNNTNNGGTGTLTIAFARFGGSASTITTSSWTNIGTIIWDIGAGSGATTVNLTFDQGNTTVRNDANTGIAAVATYTGGGGSTALPVELVAFNAENAGSVVHLTWATASEEDNMGFDVQRSIDGQNWQTIGFVEGAGNSIVLRNYAFDDAEVSTLASSTAFYRLHQMDFDGGESFSDIAQVLLEQKEERGLDFSMYPVPANNFVQLMVDNQSQNYQVDVYNPIGQLVLSDNVKGYEPVDLTGLAPGYYNFRLTDANGANTSMKRLVIKR